MIVLLTASRGYPAKDDVLAFVRALPMGTTIVTAGSPGAENWATKEAKVCGHTVEVIKAEWTGSLDRLGSYVRNERLVERVRSDPDAEKECRAFLAIDPRTGTWSGNTKHCLTEARGKGLPVYGKRPGLEWEEASKIPGLPLIHEQPYEVPEATTFDLFGEPGYDLEELRKQP